MKNTSIFKKLLNNWTSPGLLKAIRWKHSWPGDHSLPCLLCICCFWDDFLCAKCYLWLYCWFCFQPVCHSQVFCGWLKTTHLSVSQVGRIFFKESGEKQTFFFSPFFTNCLCLSFYFSVSLLQSCCKFLAIQQPGVTSLMLTLNLVFCPRGAHFHRKYASFLLVPSQLDSTFRVFNYVVVAVTF